MEVRVPEGSGRAASGVSDWNSSGFGRVADGAFRFNPFIVSSEDLIGFHGENESIRVDNFAQGIRTYIQIISNGSNE